MYYFLVYTEVNCYSVFSPSLTLSRKNKIPQLHNGSEPLGSFHLKKKKIFTGFCVLPGKLWNVFTTQSYWLHLGIFLDLQTLCSWQGKTSFMHPKGCPNSLGFPRQKGLFRHCSAWNEAFCLVLNSLKKIQWKHGLENPS